MAQVKWIKLSTDIFDNRKIKMLESMPDGDALVVIWLKILILAGEVNDGGLIYFTRDIPYTPEILSTQFNRPISTIQLALRTFEQFGMIEIVNDLIMVSNWEKYQSVDKMQEIREYNRLAKQRSRERQKLLSDVNDKSMTSQQCHGTDIDIEEDKDIDKENIHTPKETKHQYGEYKNVKLKDSELEKLKAEYGDALTHESIKFLDEYIEMKGYKAKSHYLCIRKWVIDAVKERKNKHPKQQEYLQREDSMDDVFTQF